MNWEEVENKLHKHVLSKEGLNLPVPGDSKNRVWEKVTLRSKKRQAVPMYWLAAASLLLLLLMGSWFFYTGYKHLKSENASLLASNKQLQHSNHVLKEQLLEQTNIEKPEKQKIIIKELIVYKTVETGNSDKTSLANEDPRISPNSHIDIVSKELKNNPENLLSPHLQFSKDSAKNDAIPDHSILKDENSRQDSFIAENFEQIKIDLGHTGKRSRFGIGLGGFMRDSGTQGWKASIYSKN